jgi:hypothetical protein
MPTNNSLPPDGEQHDFYAAMLAARRSPTLDTLLQLATPEPLGPPEGEICTPSGLVKIRERWPKSVLVLTKKYPGYQPGYRKCEELKYGKNPGVGAPLSEFVAARLRHGLALWSRAIGANWTKLQFTDWLALHVDWQTETPPLWPDDPGWREALELLRLAYGLPRLPPTTLNPSPLAVPGWAFHPHHIRMMSGGNK